MNDVELKEFFENIIGDSLDETFTVAILNQAKNQIERRLKPLFLQEVDESKTRNTSDNYETMKDLPSDFREMVELYVGTQRYIPVPYLDRVRYRFSAYRFYIKHRDSQFAICGTSSTAETIRQYYLVKTPDLTVAKITADSPATTILWPSEFIPLIAWEGARIVESGTDDGADDLSFRMSASQEKIAQKLEDDFTSWDHDQKLNEMDNRGGYEPETPSIEDDLQYMT